MFRIHPGELAALREKYKKGSRVRLIHMDDPFNTRLGIGDEGTVTHVDDIGTIHVAWDCGSSLGVVFGEDVCEAIKEVKA